MGKEYLAEIAERELMAGPIHDEKTQELPPEILEQIAGGPIIHPGVPNVNLDTSGVPKKENPV